MTPIVSPWFIYLLSVIENIRPIINGVCFIGVMLGVPIAVWSMVLILEGSKEELTEFHKKVRLKVFLSAFGLVTVVSLFFPSRNTIIAMYIAKQITYDRVEKTVEITKGAKDSLKKDIIDILRGIQALERKENTEK